tara:strand:+ start:2637 stop:3257 length:621 start_codon:yes stop_codon:yes gene_type:complete
MLLEKVLLGVTLAAPIGPVSIEIIRRGLASGFIAAFLVSVGAVLGDGLCLTAAYFGVGALTNNAVLMDALGLIGALFLLYLAFTNIKDRNKKFTFENVTTHAGITKSILLGFGLAIVNPLSLVFWVSIFAASTAGLEHVTFLPNYLILLGVLLWSLTLCSFLTFSKNILNKNIIKSIVLLSSLMLLFYGCKYGYVAVANLYTMTML